MIASKWFANSSWSSFWPRDSKKHSNKGFVSIDNGNMGGTH